MRTKYCYMCKTEKPTSEFSKDGKRLQSKCKACNSKYLKTHYQRNRAAYAKNVKKSKAKYLVWWKEYKSSLKCSECGENHPACLDFHHIDPNNKAYRIADMVASRLKKERVFAEIEKCQVLCSNCHRKHHYEN